MYCIKEFLDFRTLPRRGKILGRYVELYSKLDVRDGVSSLFFQVNFKRQSSSNVATCPNVATRRDVAIFSCKPDMMAAFDPKARSTQLIDSERPRAPGRSHRNGEEDRCPLPRPACMRSGSSTLQEQYSGEERTVQNPKMHEKDRSNGKPNKPRKHQTETTRK